MTKYPIGPALWLQQQNEILEEENSKLKKELADAKSTSSISGEHESIANQWREKYHELQSKLTQVQAELDAASKNASHSKDEMKWQQEKCTLEKELERTKSNLEFVDRERSTLLQQLLNLQGKARIMVRIRPPLNHESSKMMKTEIQSNYTRLTCKCSKFRFWCK